MHAVRTRITCCTWHTPKALPPCSIHSWHLRRQLKQPVSKAREDHVWRVQAAADAAFDEGSYISDAAAAAAQATAPAKVRTCSSCHMTSSVIGSAYQQQCCTAILRPQPATVCCHPCSQPNQHCARLQSLFCTVFFSKTRLFFVNSAICVFQGASMPATVFNLVNVIMGAGYVSIPFACR